MNMERGFLLGISTLYATSKSVVVCNKILFYGAIATGGGGSLLEF